VRASVLKDALRDSRLYASFCADSKASGLRAAHLDHRNLRFDKGLLPWAGAAIVIFAYSAAFVLDVISDRKRSKVDISVACDSG
jgi:hypothetical protein